MPEGGIVLKSGEGELRLDEVKINVEIVSGVAVATVDMEFFNQQHKQLEGELDFPLPEDAVVCGYSYEFQGHMVPASVVEKEEARITFEKEVRSGGAVSLVEHVKGNSFKVRVYPLPPNARKRVSLTFMLDLPSREGSQVFQLPFHIDKPVKLQYTVRVQKPKTAPMPFSEYEELQTSENNGTHVYEVKKDNATMTPTSFKVTIPISTEPADPDVFVGEKDLAITGEPDEVFFLVHDYPKDPSANAASTISFIKKLGIVWDASYSMNGVDRTRELEIIKGIAKSTEKIDLVVFRNVQEPTETFSGRDIQKLIKFLEELDYDGGSDIANLVFPEGCNTILLCTDGFSTLSTDIPIALPTCPIFALVSSAKANVKTLKYVANKTGGKLFNLPEFESDDSAVSAIVKGSPFRFLRADYNKNEISDLFPDASFVVENGEKVSFCGKLKAPTATLRLHYGTDPNSPSLTRTVTLSQSNSIGHSDILPRVWAQAKADSLSLLPSDSTKKEIVELGRKYNLVTPGTSLLVLTTFDQYLKYGIQPNPEALPEVYDMYVSHFIKKHTDEAAAKKAKLDKVFGWWETRKNWWDRDYTDAQKSIYRSMLGIPLHAYRSERTRSSSSSAVVESDSDHDDECCEMEEEQLEKKEEEVEEKKMKDKGDVKEKKMKSKTKVKAMKEVEKESMKKSLKSDSCFSAQESSVSYGALAPPPPPPGAAPPQMQMQLETLSAPPPPSFAPSPSLSAPPPPVLLSSPAPLSAPPPLGGPPPPAPSPLSPSKKLSSAGPALSKSKSLAPSSASVPSPSVPSGAASGPSASGPSASGPSASGPSAPTTASAGIKIKEWTPDREYLRAIKVDADVKDQYKNYLLQRQTFGSAPSFFLDVATYFYTTSAPHLGVRIITTLLELKLEDHRLLRIVGNSLFLQKYNTQAKWLLQKVLSLRGEEPQSYREIALVHRECKEYQEAVDLLWKIVETAWPDRFTHIEDEVLMQLNRTIFEANQESNNNSSNKKIDTSKIDERFLRLMPVNIHCSITWDTDDTCIDLHIVEPNGTTCNYCNHVTTIGGFSSPDYPGCTAYSTSMLREYMIKSALPGTYKLKCNYYSNYRQDLTAGTTMWFTVTTNFGTGEQVSNTTTLRLECNSTSPTTRSEYEIGTVAYGINPQFQAWKDEFEGKPPGSTPQEPTKKPEPDTPKVQDTPKETPKDTQKDTQKDTPKDAKDAKDAKDTKDTKENDTKDGKDGKDKKSPPTSPMQKSNSFVSKMKHLFSK